MMMSCRMRIETVAETGARGVLRMRYPCGSEGEPMTQA